METAFEILKKPYHRSAVADADGSFFAEIAEFPGCFATSDTEEEALASLEDVAASWLGACLQQGQSVPEPFP